MTDYYVDSSASGANNGSSPTDAWTSIASATAITSSGHRIWIRRTHSETLAATLTISSSAANTNNDPTYWIGWPISGDPFYDTRPAAGTTAGWDSDSTAVKPAIANSFAGTQCQINSNANKFGGMHRVSLSSTAVASTNFIYSFNLAKMWFYECDFDNSASTSTSAVTLILGTSGFGFFEKCTFTGKDVASANTLVLNVGGSNAPGNSTFIDCTISNGGAYQVSVTSSARTYFYGCTFTPGANQTHHFRTASMEGLRTYCLGCTFNGSLTFLSSASSAFQGRTESANHDGVLNSYFAINNNYQIESTAAITNGASYSLILTPLTGDFNDDYSNPTPNGQWPYQVYGFPFHKDDTNWNIYAGAEETTVTVYVYTREWSTLPTADNLYLTAIYNGDANGKPASVRSTGAVSGNTTWTPLTVTFTPAAAGIVYLTLTVQVYESGAPTRDILVDPLPVVA